MTRKEFLQRIKNNKAVSALMKRLPEAERKKVESRMHIISNYVHDTLLMSAGQALSNKKTRDAFNEVVTKKHKESQIKDSERPIIKDDDGKPEVSPENLEQTKNVNDDG